MSFLLRDKVSVLRAPVFREIGYDAVTQVSGTPSSEEKVLGLTSALDRPRTVVLRLTSTQGPFAYGLVFFFPTCLCNSAKHYIALSDMVLAYMLYTGSGQYCQLEDDTDVL